MSDDLQLTEGKTRFDHRFSDDDLRILQFNRFANGGILREIEIELERRRSKRDAEEAARK